MSSWSHWYLPCLSGHSPIGNENEDAGRDASIVVLKIVTARDISNIRTRDVRTRMRMRMSLEDDEDEAEAEAHNLPDVFDKQG